MKREKILKFVHIQNKLYSNFSSSGVLIYFNFIMFQSIKLLYASSSSVYGKSSQVPLDPSISLVLTSPNNMYAATKRTDEMLSNLYCRDYNMTSVGLRFFTVYGPWGRPDMAVYKFVEAVLKGQPIHFYSSRYTFILYITISSLINDPF